MKTFETEKHNIPEGATHYSNETDTLHFAWRKGLLNVQVPDIDLKWVACYLDREWKPIPQTNTEVKKENNNSWVNGEKTSIKICGVVTDFIFGCECPGGNGTCIVFTENATGHMVMPISRLMKPETQQQREERECEELSYIACESIFGESIQNCRPDVSATVRSMIEAGYRKDE